MTPWFAPVLCWVRKKNHEESACSQNSFFFFFLWMRIQGSYSCSSYLKKTAVFHIITWCLDLFQNPINNSSFLLNTERKSRQYQNWNNLQTVTCCLNSFVWNVGSCLFTVLWQPASIIQTDTYPPELLERWVFW